MLGGAYSQIPAIQYARAAGYHVLTCDYLPDNPGHQYAHQFFNVSTTDKEKVLHLAREMAIDGIVAYASDPSAPAAAYICDALRLPGASYRAVRILAEKDLFRAFLRDNGFPYPAFHSLASEADLARLVNLDYPVYVKPVDSSGSKGITRVEKSADLQAAVSYAFQFSRCHRVIVEANVSSPYQQLHGDGFVYDRELVFLGLCDHHFKDAAPVASTFPTRLDHNLTDAVFQTVQRVIRQVGFDCGGINVEARVSGDQVAYIMEIGPRSGGNYIPQLMACGTGFDEVAAIIDTAMGHPPEIKTLPARHHCLQYIIGAEQSGVLAGIECSKTFQDKIVHLYQHRQAGDEVHAYHNSANVVGVVIARCLDAEDLRQTMHEIKNHVRVIVR
jgi:biotin carboxylase